MFLVLISRNVNQGCVLLSRQIRHLSVAVLIGLVLPQILRAWHANELRNAQVIGMTAEGSARPLDESLEQAGRIRLPCSSRSPSPPKAQGELQCTRELTCYTFPLLTLQSLEKSFHKLSIMHGTYLGEESVEAVDLLLLFNKSVVLRDTLQGQLIHKVDDVRLVQPSLFEVLDCHWEGG